MSWKQAAESRRRGSAAADRVRRIPDAALLERYARIRSTVLEAAGLPPGEAVHRLIAVAVETVGRAGAARVSRVYSSRGEVQGGWPLPRARRLSLHGLWLITLLSCAPEDEDTATELQLQEPGLSLATTPIHVEGSSTLDTLNLFWVSAYQFSDGEHHLVDSGNSRVLGVREADGRTRVIARTGRGPGEVLRPTDLTVSGDRIIVFDTGNRRVTTFNRDGAPVAELRVPSTARSAALGMDGGVLTIDPTGASALLGAEGSKDSFRPIGHRRFTPYDPAAPYPVRADGLGHHALDLVTETGGVAWVAHAHDGLLVSVDLATEEQKEFTLPDAVVEAVASEKRRIDEALPVSPGASPFYKSLDVLPNGELILGISFDDMIALVVDPESASVTPVRVQDPDHPAHSAVGFSPGPEDGTIAVRGIGGITFFTLQGG